MSEVIRHGVMHAQEPIVKTMPKFQVKCVRCGYKHDADAENEQEAIAVIAGQHRHFDTDPKFVARAVDYSGHPHYRSLDTW